MKSHNPALCSVCSKRSLNKTDTPKKTARNLNVHDVLHDASRIEESSGVSSLDKVLQVLNQEFSVLKIEYSKLIKLYEEISGKEDADFLSSLKPVGDKLRECLKSLEVKGDQISIVKSVIDEGKVGKKVEKKVEKRIEKAPSVASLSILKSTTRVQNALRSNS